MVMLLGFIIAAICALTGAGGPILLVPVLVSLGIQIRVAVGVSLLNSVVIALPSISGYFAHATAEITPMLIITSLLGIMIGIVTGARLANKVPVHHLKLTVAMITILSSIYMLATLHTG
ncbi:TSUP family transporter [Virgibacillus halophilus]|uniref:Probable membrane transporter protein n=2 Tax=Tigheibacillus halophilus TaxID=361280 RepID=A0ABU5C5Y6_9BACI|nr:TSUP family transporter [Virgibacillus halophilus]